MTTYLDNMPKLLELDNALKYDLDSRGFLWMYPDKHDAGDQMEFLEGTQVFVQYGNEAMAREKIINDHGLLMLPQLGMLGMYPTPRWYYFVKTDEK